MKSPADTHPLNTYFCVSQDTVSRFQQDGHAVVRELASRQEIAAYKSSIDDATMACRWDNRPLDERDTYGKAFIQSANICQYDPNVAAFVYARRFARVAAELLECDGVRLYHDQALYKEPGGGFTPWHQDQVYWPLDTTKTITMWMPLVDVPSNIGGMTFADQSWQHGNLGEQVIGDESHAHFEMVVKERGFSLSTHGPFAPGDATFHRGWTLHSAPANNTDIMRSVMTIIYFADGTNIGVTDHPARELDLALWLGGAATGTPAISTSNPLLWHRSWDE